MRNRKRADRIPWSAPPTRNGLRARTTMGRAAHDGTSPEPAPRRCVVVGASARAFVESLARAGWVAHAADLFGDVDLAAAAIEVVRLGVGGSASYPQGIPAVVAKFPEAVCVYTGALENHPDVIAAIAATRPLAGCSADAVRRVRDPAALAAIVRDAGQRCPDTFRSPAGLPTDGSFLVKPLRSAGGRGVRRWRGGSSDHAGHDVVWQRFVDGVCRSANYVARAGTARLVGSSLPLAAAHWCGGREFSYCGSIDVPIDQLPDRLRRTFENLGTAVAATCGLTGLFGIDAVVDAADEVHVLEVNPRPTASLELVERTTGWSVAAAHLAACGWCEDPPCGTAADGFWAKAVVSTPSNATAASVADAIATASVRWTAEDGLPSVADIPRPDEPPSPGAPLVTVFARGDTPDRVVATLRQRVLHLRRSVANGLSPRAAVPSAAWRPRGSTA